MITKKKSVTLDPGRSQDVEFTIRPTTVGLHHVAVGDLTGKFDVVAGIANLHILMTDTENNPLPVSRISYDGGHQYTNGQGEADFELAPGTYNFTFGAETCTTQTKQIVMGGVDQSIHVQLKCIISTEFVISNLTIAPTEAAVGSYIKLSVDVTNIGKAEGWYYVNWEITYPDGSKVTDSHPCIPGPGLTYTDWFGILATQAGSYTVVANTLSSKFTASKIADVFKYDGLNEVYSCSAGLAWWRNHMLADDNAERADYYRNWEKYRMAINSFKFTADNRTWSSKVSASLEYNFVKYRPFWELHAEAVREKIYYNGVYTIYVPPPEFGPPHTPWTNLPLVGFEKFLQWQMEHPSSLKMPDGGDRFYYSISWNPFAVDECSYLAGFYNSGEWGIENKLPTTGKFAGEVSAAGGWWTQREPYHDKLDEPLPSDDYVVVLYAKAGWYEAGIKRSLVTNIYRIGTIKGG